MYGLHLRQLLTILLLFVTPAMVFADDGQPYAAAIKQLDALIEREVAGKQLPALSIALVDDQKVVWAKGYGFADPAAKTPATADTVYRIGAVTEFFTAVAVMQLVEQGVLDLDEPVTKYLPDFKPTNPFGKPITLRHLLAERSGLVGEPPVGSYFDPTAPTLANTVASLNQTTLLFEPGSRVKYSDAATATAGLVVEVTQKTPFARYLAEKVLAPAGMKSTGFEARSGAAKGLMTTYHGREFPAPTFGLGVAPACGLYSSAGDLARFLSMLFAGGKGTAGQVVRPETLQRAWEVQFARPGQKQGYGIGCQVGAMAGRREIAHSGTAYGFAAGLGALPNDKLGVVVLTSVDGARAETEYLASQAMRCLLAAKGNNPLPTVRVTTALPPIARQLAGRWQSGAKTLDLEEFAGRLWSLSGRGGVRTELRATDDALVPDDRLTRGTRIQPIENGLKIGPDTFQRVAEEKPTAAPAKWRGLIGEYGWDDQTLYILERNGKLHALVEWFFYYPLEEESADVFRFPNFGVFAGEKIVFNRDKTGRATRAVAGSVAFERRKMDGENGETFRIKAQRPLADLRREAAAATPPREEGNFRQPDLLDLTVLDPGIKLDIRYATDNNFLSTPFYTSARAFMQRPAAEAVARVHRSLAERGFGLLIFDGYRPWSVTKMFWEATPEKQRIFVADPSKGSRHNRGCAVDLTLYDLKSGKPIEMVGGYDEMSDRSYPQYPGGTSLQRWHRELLRHAMEAEGFTVYEAEWWHFDYKDWRSYPILNKSFEELSAAKP
jgi:CubicO group peptidase (beta-lactamase class C family)/D-alanyl-D-alanine dipeptidase